MSIVSPDWEIATTSVRSSTTGRLVALSNVVHLRTFADAQALGRYNKLRSITVSASLAPGYTLGEALDWLDGQAAQIPEVTQVGYKGESLAFRQTGSAIMVVFALTVVIVYELVRRWEIRLQQRSVAAELATGRDLAREAAGSTS